MFFDDFDLTIQCDELGEDIFYELDKYLAEGDE